MQYTKLQHELVWKAVYQAGSCTHNRPLDGEYLPRLHVKFTLWLLQFVITHLQSILDAERKITS